MMDMIDGMSGMMGAMMLLGLLLLALVIGVAVYIPVRAAQRPQAPADRARDAATPLGGR